MRDLINEALKEVSANHRRIAYRVGGRAIFATLGQPIAEYENWNEMIHLGKYAPWNPRQALEKLDVQQIPFVEKLDREGYSTGRKLAISDKAPLPLSVLFHELGHIVLKHTVVGGETDPCIREVQAETVAFCCQTSIGALTVESMCASRVYISKNLEGISRPLHFTDLDDIETAVGTILAAGQ